jgi:hypothetical protein
MNDRLHFAEIDRRARAGERLNVVFFGCSLTWGANASDPQLTSYRARVAERFEESYPEAHFKFWDAAIGGTSSHLGVFRFERDVLSRKPDLVFLDFTLNDNHHGTDEETLGAYESLVRRTITEANCPAVLAFFPGAAEVREADKVLPRDEAHRAIGVAYGCGIGDAVALMRSRGQEHPDLIAQWWSNPADQTHPGDRGYAQYAEAAWEGYLQSVQEGRVCRAPEHMLHTDAFMHWRRMRLSGLGTRPAGWNLGRPNRISAWYDSLMSRWLDDEMIAANEGRNPEPWEIEVNGTFALLYGEMTPRSGQLQVLIDGKPSDLRNKGIFDLSSKAAGGNVKLSMPIARGLRSGKHRLTLKPLLKKGEELRIESVCVAGESVEG